MVDLSEVPSRDSNSILVQYIPAVIVLLEQPNAMVRGSIPTMHPPARIWMPSRQKLWRFEMTKMTSGLEAW